MCSNATGYERHRLLSVLSDCNPETRSGVTCRQPIRPAVSPLWYNRSGSQRSVASLGKVGAVTAVPMWWRWSFQEHSRQINLQQANVEPGGVPGPLRAFFLYKRNRQPNVGCGS